jgi:hypothetical protein
MFDFNHFDDITPTEFNLLNLAEGIARHRYENGLAIIVEQQTKLAQAYLLLSKAFKHLARELD